MIKFNRYYYEAAIAIAILVLLSTGCSEPESRVISMQTLLEEMVDRDKITEFPTVSYKTKQASSYNRESVSPNSPGWFADSDGVYSIRTEERDGETEWVLMEDDGPGAIIKIWAVCFYYGMNNTTGANINFYLDGAIEPSYTTNFFSLVKGQDFVGAPFADSTARAGNIYFPIPYNKGCKITMDQKAFYNIINYRSYPKGTEVRTFSLSEFAECKELRDRVAKTLIETPDELGEKSEQSKELSKGDHLEYRLPDGEGVVKQIEVTVDTKGDIGEALRHVVLQGVFDDNTTVWAPVGDFFNNVEKRQPYKMWEREVKSDGTMVCRWAMPYQRGGSISLINLGDTKANVSLKITTDKRSWSENSMHFYASWRMDDPYPTFPLFDWNFLHAKGAGVVVGDQWTVLNPRSGWWGEGDEKIYIDEDIEKNFPSHFGTGTEDYYGWAGGVVPTPADQFSKPFLGNIIVGSERSKGYNVCTRTRVLDAIPFQKEIKFDIESSCGTRQRWHFLQYSQTTFWYGKPGVTYNRKPLEAMASKPLPRLKELEAMVEKAKSETYTVDNALEAEALPLVTKSSGVEENLNTIPVWGEKSGGATSNYWFKEAGEYVEYKITEQFEESTIEICAAVGRCNGTFKISVNGIDKITQSLGTEHNGMTTPLVKLEKCKPVDNAFVVRFTYVGESKTSQKRDGYLSLGVDYFFIKNNFLTKR